MQYLLFIMAGMGFFSSSSVSFSERSDALWTNPAGLGLHPDGIELQSGFSMFEGDVGFNLGLASGFTGLGYRTGSEEIQLYHTQDIDMSCNWGGEIRVGRKFCCDPCWRKHGITTMKASAPGMTSFA